MAVYIPDKLWGGSIPYVIADENPLFAQDHIYAFNARVGKEVFVPGENESDYVEFKESSGHATCKIGKQGGKQTLNYGRSDASIFHEMGHCAGLGHENFHTGWPARSVLMDRKNNSLHAMAFQRNQSKYQNVTSYDRLSVMLYGSKSLGVSEQQFLQKAIIKEQFVQNTVLSELDVIALRQLYALVEDM
jgi:Astacin (Peptidase family M12A)